MMDDLRRVAHDTGPPSSFVYSRIFLTWEQYKGFDVQLLISIGSALAAIFLIILIFSGNLCTSVLALCMMGLVDLNLVALIWYWGLELNFITMVNIIQLLVWQLITQLIQLTLTTSPKQTLVVKLTEREECPKCEELLLKLVLRCFTVRSLHSWRL